MLAVQDTSTCAQLYFHKHLFVISGMSFGLSKARQNSNCENMYLSSSYVFSLKIFFFLFYPQMGLKSQILTFLSDATLFCNKEMHV